MIDRISQIRLAVSELSTNIIKHAKWGKVILSIEPWDGKTALVVTADDWGTGIQDMDRVMAKGFSTAGTLGIGFTVMQNNTDFMEVKNTDHGLMVQMGWFLEATQSRDEAGFDHYELVRPMRGYTASGDHVCVKILKNKVFFAALFDVLGHGNEAHRSVKRIRKACQGFYFQGLTSDPERLMLEVGHALAPQSTRAAVAAAGIFIPGDHILHIAGTGNISVALLVDGHFILPAFYGGVIGDGRPNIKQYAYEVRHELLWGMTSDGFASDWSTHIKHPISSTAKGIAEAAVRTSFRDSDDSSIMVMRWKSN